MAYPRHPAGTPDGRVPHYVLTRLTAPGSFYLGLIAMFPLVALAASAVQPVPVRRRSILIMVGVGLDTVKQIESQLQQRNYEGFLK